MRSADYRTPFERCCRVPGTRINAIMEMIERGMTDEEIADTIKHTPSKYRGMNPNANCDAKTIRVYRKALYGTLVEASGEAFRTDERPGDGLIKKLKAQGMTVPAICEAMGLRRRQVEGRLYSKKRRKAKKAAPENAGGVTPQSPAVTAPLAGEPSILRELGLDEAEAARLLMRYGSAETRGKVIDILMAILREDEERGSDPSVICDDSSPFRGAKGGNGK